MKTQTSLSEINNDVNSQLQAQDLLTTNNFVPGPLTGTHWHFQAPTSMLSVSQPVLPNAAQDALRHLNKSQTVLDALVRE